MKPQLRISQWLPLIPDAAAALENYYSEWNHDTRIENFDRLFDCADEALLHAFDWNRSKQGREWWALSYRALIMCPIKLAAPTLVQLPWSKQKPEFKEDCMVLRATWNGVRWEVYMDLVERINDADGSYMAWLDLTGDEIGSIDEMQADLYAIIAFPGPLRGGKND
jgi:hypothetical protein